MVASGCRCLNLQASGNATAALNYAFNLGVGVDAGGFYFNAATDNLRIGVTTTLPATFTTNIGALRFQANAAGTSFTPSIGLNLNDTDGTNDGKLRSLTGNYLSPTLSGTAAIKLALTGDMSSTALPSINANLAVDWNFGTAAAPSDLNALDNIVGSPLLAMAPKVAFNNVSIGLGSFFTNLLGRYCETCRPSPARWYRS